MSGLQGCVIRQVYLGRSVVGGSREASVAHALQPRIPTMNTLCCLHSYQAICFFACLYDDLSQVVRMLLLEQEHA